MSSLENEVHSNPHLTDVATTALHDRVRSWKTLSLSEKKEDFLSFINATTADELYTSLCQLEALYARGQIYAPDFCLLIGMASCAPFAIHILRTRSEISLLISAARVFRTHWSKTVQTLEKLLSECGGTGGLIEIIASLPTRIASGIIRAIGGRPCKEKDINAEAELRTQALESIIRAAIPVSSSNTSSPLKIHRLASVIFSFLIPVASESLLRTLIPSFERSIKPKTWKALAHRHPLLISQLILIQLGAKAAGLAETWNNGGVLQSPDRLLPALLVLCQYKKLPNTFLLECLTLYASQVKGGTRAGSTGIFGPHSDVLSRLSSNGLIAIALQERPKERNEIQHVLGIVDVLATIHAAEGKEDWGWTQVSLLVEYAMTQFSYHSEEWVSPQKSQLSPPTAETPTATMLLNAIFKRFTPSIQAFSSPPISIISHLESMPMEARFSFWSIAYFIRFAVDLTDTSVTPPPLSTFLLYIIGSTQGDRIVRRGIETHGNKFFLDSETPQFKFSSLPANVLHDLFRTTSPSEIGEESFVDFNVAVLRASWLGSNTKQWGDVLDPDSKDGWEDVRRDVIEFKRLAAHARTGSERLALLQVLFAIVFNAHNLDLLDDTLTWMAKRFAKDPVAGIGMWFWLCGGEHSYYVAGEVALHTMLSRPMAKVPRNEKDPSSFIENLKEYFHRAGKVLRTLRAFLDMLAAEPGASVDFYWTIYGDLLEKIIQERIHLVAGFSDSFRKHRGLREAVFEDLSPLILSHGITGRLEPHPIPGIGVVDISIPCRLVGIIVPWMDDLGAKVDDLYRAGYRAELKETLELPSRGFQFWPFEVTFLDKHGKTLEWFSEDVDFDITTTHYYRLVESWLFSPHSVLLSEAADDPDRYPRHTYGRQRLEQYVDDYLTFSKSRKEITGKIEHLLSHYGPQSLTSSDDDEGTVCAWEDHSLLILSIPRIRRELQHSPILLEAVIDKVLPQYPPSKEPTEILHYDLFSSFPKVPTLKESSVLWYSTQKLSDPDRYRSNSFVSLLQDLPNPDSPRHMERLAFLVVAHLTTVFRLPKFRGAKENGPITDALRYFRLTNAKALLGQHRHKFRAEQLLRRCLAYISANDVTNLTAAITAIPMADHPRETTIALLGALRRYRDPDICIGLSFHVLEDMESSTWHRRTLPRSLLQSVRPEIALSILNRFLDFLSARRREQLLFDAGKSRRLEGAEVDMDGQSTKSVLKISTIKMLPELLSIGIQDGVFPGSTCNLAYRVMDVSIHESVLEAVINVFLQIILMEDITSTSTTNNTHEVDGLWGHLRSFVQKGIRLAEHVELTDEVWDAALRGDAPMPVIETSHVIACALLEVKFEQFSPSVQGLWIDEVLVPLLCGHVANRTKWLKVALSREGGSDQDVSQIYGSFDEKFHVPIYFGKIVEYSRQGPTKGCAEALVPILEQRLNASTLRRPFETLSNLARLKHKEDKDAQTYLKDIRLLTSHALGNDTNAFAASISNIVKCIKLPAAHPEVVAYLVKILERTGESFLAPENMLIGKDPAVKTSPFARFLEMLSRLSPPIVPLDSQWYTRIRPILVFFLDKAEGLESEQSKVLKNGGACYWPVIISLKVLLLPFPTLPPYKDAHDRAEKYAQGLVDLVKNISSHPLYHRLFSSYVLAPVKSSLRCGFVDVLPVCRSLTALFPPETDTQDLRRLCFEIAINLIGSFSQEFEDRPGDPQLEERDGMLRAWSDDPDGIVRWMALR